MLLAQGLGEYGALASRSSGGDGSSSFRDLIARIEDFIHGATPMQWAMIGGFCFALWFVFLRRR